MAKIWQLLDADPSIRKALEDFDQKWASTAPFQFVSSGSTGPAKSHQFTKAQVLASAKRSNRAFELTASSRVLLCLSLKTVGGYMQLARAKAAGFELFIQKATSRPLQHWNGPLDFVAMVPTQLHESLRHDLEKLRQCRCILIGGGALSAVDEALVQTYKLPLWQSYGMTETLSHVALRRVSESTYFEALAGVSFSQMNGCLCINDAQLGITNLMTTDCVRLLDQTHFEWLGRADFAINTGGFKVHPEAIETKLSSQLSTPFFISSLPDPKWGNIVVLLIEGTAPIPSNFNFLETHERPKKIAYSEAFSRSASGKILRTETLKRLDASAWKLIESKIE
ncbi:MAG: hypothetical protein RLZZ301_237 [Bacteroidota bacterium]|jgi:O-succinylbenzoic acid--CoA ligase